MSSGFGVWSSPSPLETRNQEPETGGEGQGWGHLDPLGDIPPDEGCDLAPSCLRCPFPRCRYDDPGLVQRLRGVERRRQQARRLAGLVEEGLAVEAAAARLGVSRRTAFRVLAVRNAKEAGR